MHNDVRVTAEEFAELYERTKKKGKMKIVIQARYGEFSLSRKAINELAKRGVAVDEFGNGIERHDPRLVEVVEMLGDDADDDGDIKVVEIPDDVKDWYITDYDGKETVREGRYWE